MYVGERDRDRERARERQTDRQRDRRNGIKQILEIRSGFAARQRIENKIMSGCGHNKSEGIKRQTEKAMLM